MKKISSEGSPKETWCEEFFFQKSLHNFQCLLFGYKEFWGIPLIFQKNVDFSLWGNHATTWKYFLTFSSETKIMKIRHSAPSSLLCPLSLNNNPANIYGGKILMTYMNWLYTKEFLRCRIWHLIGHHNAKWSPRDRNSK